VRLHAQKILNALPPIWPDDLLPAIREQVTQRNESIVVLDDDPTGTQTVYDTPILTDWNTDALRNEFERATGLFYVLTNSRSLSSARAEQLASRIGSNLQEASKQTHRKFIVISRSDSTLRGHYPVEVDALAQALGKATATHVIIPFFKEGGRLTIGDVHYVLEDDYLIPVAQTPFARDAVFGYKHSDLKEWVQEKTQGRIACSSVVSLGLDDIRRGGPEKIAEKLRSCKPHNVCIVNAALYRDLEVVTLGLLWAEQQGIRFLYRTAASFVRVIAGLDRRTLVTKDQLHATESAGGLIVMGSHVPRSSAQLVHLIKNTGINTVELRAGRVLSPLTRQIEIQRVTSLVEKALSRAQDIVLYTSRDLVTGADDEATLSIGSRISDALVETVKALKTRPKYILAKGGITSSDIATKALGLRRAEVLGQILPGVPVWRTGPESRFPELPYIVFPGNVGQDDAITYVVRKLRDDTNIDTKGKDNEAVLSS